jgi:hypothetical protein
MKKLVLIVATVALFSLCSNAQGTFVKGTKLFKFGVGMNGDGTPVEAGFEAGVTNNFLGVKGMVLGLGANLGYYGYKEDFSSMAGSYSWKYSNIVITGRAMAHYPFIKKLDTYAGLVLGYNVGSVTYSGSNAGSMPSPSVGGVVWGGLIGARYEFSKNWGAYIELGKSTANACLGVAYKF